MFRLVSALACVLLAAAAQAQVTTSRVNVLITGTRCGELRNVFLVIDNEDAEDKWLRLKNEGDCHWSADLGTTFSTALSHFSLRFDLGRTDCRQAIPNDERELSALLEFACCKEEPLHDIHVRTKPPLPVSYLRQVPKADDDVRIRALGCTEGAAFPAGAGWIRHTQFSVEDVYLQFGAVKPKPRMDGLLLDDVALHGNALTVTRDGVVYRFIVQRAKERTSAPTFSSNAIAIDVEQLRQLKLESVEFQESK